MFSWYSISCFLLLINIVLSNHCIFFNFNIMVQELFSFFNFLFVVVVFATMHYWVLVQCVFHLHLHSTLRGNLKLPLVIVLYIIIGLHYCIICRGAWILIYSHYYWIHWIRMRWLGLGSQLLSSSLTIHDFLLIRKSTGRGVIAIAMLWYNVHEKKSSW